MHKNNKNIKNETLSSSNCSKRQQKLDTKLLECLKKMQNEAEAYIAESTKIN